jgi:signal transduction histidine kinase
LGEIPPLNANEAEIYQVFLNLILNASDAIQAKGSGELTLTTQAVKMQKTGGEIADGVEIRVKDTGCGISQENLDKLFDPFFSTKEKGSGLGLSRTAEIVAEYNGTIEVETEVDKGTAFIVRLPRS